MCKCLNICKAFIDIKNGDFTGGVLKKISDPRKAGKKVEAIYVTCPTEVAVERAIERGKKTKRCVNEEVIRDTHRNVSQILPQVASKFDKTL